jgi:hypothetical protein
MEAESLYEIKILEIPHRDGAGLNWSGFVCDGTFVRRAEEPLLTCCCREAARLYSVFLWFTSLTENTFQLGVASSTLP